MALLNDGGRKQYVVPRGTGPNRFVTLAEALTIIADEAVGDLDGVEVVAVLDSGRPVQCVRLADLKTALQGKRAALVTELNKL